MNVGLVVELLERAKTCELREVELLHKEIANGNYGVEDVVLKEIWVEAWQDDQNHHFPEVKNNHDIRFLTKLMEKFA